MTPPPTSLWPAAIQTTILGLKLRIADPAWLAGAAFTLLLGGWAG